MDRHPPRRTRAMSSLRASPAFTLVVLLAFALFGFFGLVLFGPPQVVPLLAYAVASAGQQRAVADEHAALGHYGFMAAFALTVVAVGLLASLRPDGWWLPAWVAGLLPALLGLLSLAAPDVESGLAPM